MVSLLMLGIPFVRLVECCQWLVNFSHLRVRLPLPFFFAILFARSFISFLVLTHSLTLSLILWCFFFFLILFLSFFSVSICQLCLLLLSGFSLWFCGFAREAIYFLLHKQTIVISSSLSASIKALHPSLPYTYLLKYSTIHEQQQQQQHQQE